MSSFSPQERSRNVGHLVSVAVQFTPGMLKKYDRTAARNAIGVVSVLSQECQRNVCTSLSPAIGIVLLYPRNAKEIKYCFTKKKEVCFAFFATKYNLNLFLIVYRESPKWSIAVYVVKIRCEVGNCEAQQISKVLRETEPYSTIPGMLKECRAASSSDSPISTPGMCKKWDDIYIGVILGLN